MNKLSRKEFIVKSLRLASFTFLFSVSGYLIFRKESDETCNTDFMCDRCSKLKKCKLPEAKKFNSKKNELKKKLNSNT